MILLVAIVTGALVTSVLPAQITDRIGAAVCRVPGEDCGPDRTTASQSDDPGAERGEAEGPAGRGQADAPGGDAAETPAGDGEEGKGDYWSCGWFGQTACDMVQGFGRGAKEAFDGAAGTACLIHICSHSGFKHSWGGVKQLFTDPGDSLKAMWDDSTKGIREDWKNGHEASAMTRTIPSVFGMIFGGKGLNKLGDLAKARKAAKADPHAAKTASESAKAAVRRAEDAAAKFDIKGAEAALKEAEKHLRDAEKATKRSPTNQNLYDTAVARERVAHARTALVDARVRSIMVKTAVGRQAQKILDRYKPNVVYRRGGGGFYTSSNNTIYIDTRWSQNRQAVVLIHEASHVEFQHTGRTVNGRARELSRSDYVEGMLREEAHGRVLEVEANRELREQGLKIPRNTHESIYEDAYERAVKAADQESKDHGWPPMDQVERSQIGKRAGTKAILDEYRAGRVRPSIATDQPYTEYYGAAWDRINGTAP
ncbi:DUF6782 family putative metallopeptidase [Actinomadura sp. HBU206391]|uniref:DUF6782 family putative metallopeptidase n=1 Tax=Actinomadura sp. HBU206391 TaxID=2731692 RepID=UPI00164EE985|nr:DUF6782 family putative metallopeptidase [Actinomadura sp. HBU206391]MBC6457532.1 ImmA/IrrE family metallo-endopeptidase [Actinomadura sp. HBU206391]